MTGKLLTVATPEAGYTFVYDDGLGNTGQLQTVAIGPDLMSAATSTLTYTYDGDLMTGESLTGDVTGSVTWGYDNQLRLDEETAAADTVAYGYDTQGRLTTMGAMTATYVPTTGQLDTTTLTDVVASYSYDAFGDLAGILYEDGGAAVYEVVYTRDSYGRVETKTETLDGSSTLHCYEYDNADRLADVYDAADSLGCTGTNLESYSYDANGNRSVVTNSAGTIGVGGIVTDNQDRLLTHGDVTYAYNEDGQLESRTDTPSGDVWLYTYDALGNLLEVDPPGMTGTVTYTIDPRNRRVGKSVGGVMVQQFLYGDQLNPVAEVDGTGALVSRFVYGSSDHVPDYMVRGGVTYRFLTDQLGSVVGVLNLTSGLLAQTREYDAYGRIVGGGTVEAGFSQPFGFAGGLYDEDTGLVRFGARDYRPEVGSWAAKDPLRFGAGDGLLYGYVLQDPVNATDKSGEFPEPARIWNAWKWFSPVGDGFKVWGQVYALAAIVSGGELGFDTEKLVFVVDRSPLVDWHMEGSDSGFTPNGDIVCLGTRASSDTYEHEYQHVRQSDLFQNNVLYSFLHATAQLYSYVTTGSYHKGNWLEQGPYSSPSRPWPW